jgi:DNA repair exonuclease SbcCD ATPase subunit
MGLLDKFSSGSSGRTPTSGGPKRAYGIEKVAELMRSLPTENMDLVVQVVKKTLESFNVDVSGIIGDAEQKLGAIQSRIDRFEGEIAKFRKEIEEREGEIKSLKEDFQEISEIKSHLEAVKASTDEADVPEYARKATAAKKAAEKKAAEKKPPEKKEEPKPADKGKDKIPDATPEPKKEAAKADDAAKKDSGAKSKSAFFRRREGKDKPEGEGK